MMKVFLILLVLAIAIGWYWMIATGTWADRTIAMHMRKAGGAATGEDLLSHMTDVREITQRQQEWIGRLAFVARNPDSETLKTTAAVVQQLYDAAARLDQSEGTDTPGAQGESLRQAIRSNVLHTGFLKPGQRTFWAFAFWLCAVGAAISGLLSFVRAASDV